MSQDMLVSAGGEYQHAAAANLEALQEVCPYNTQITCTNIVVLHVCFALCNNRNEVPI